MERPTIREDMKALFAEVRENHRKLNECPAHRFSDDTPAEVLRFALGKRLTCAKCGGTMSAIDARTYILGYIAAGGNPNDIWPGWN